MKNENKNPQPFTTTAELREEYEARFRTIDFCNTGSGVTHINIAEQTRQEIADFWLQKMSEHKERLIKEVGELPTICGICERSGVNIYGECKCSYQTNKFVKKSDVIDILRRLQSV